MTELFALLWSKSQNCFHVEPLERTAQSGQRFFRGNLTNDYLLIGFGSEDDIDVMADKLRPLVIEREEVKRLYEPE